MIDLLLPSTDGGVLAQVVAVLIVGTTGAVASRRKKELRLIIIGSTAFALALMGFRALH
ncbi:MAG: hypothetical protein WD354_06945 [Acidimicrobiia bacterium]